MMITRRRWAAYIGQMHHAAGERNPPYMARFAWRYDPDARVGMFPYKHEIGICWEWRPRIFWRTFERAWGSTVRVHHDGRFDATAWTGRDREFIGWCWRFEWWKS